MSDGSGSQTSYMHGAAEAFTSNPQTGMLPMITKFQVDGNGFMNTSQLVPGPPAWKTIDDMGALDEGDYIYNYVLDSNTADFFTTETPFSQRGKTVLFVQIVFYGGTGISGTINSWVVHDTVLYPAGSHSGFLQYFSADAWSNPSTGQPWLWSELSSIELGVSLVVPNTIGASAIVHHIYGNVGAFDLPLPAFLEGKPPPPDQTILKVVIRKSSTMTVSVVKNVIITTKVMTFFQKIVKVVKSLTIKTEA